VGELLVGADRVVVGPEDRDLLGLVAEVERSGVDDERAEAVTDDGEGGVARAVAGMCDRLSPLGDAKVKRLV
jgi:hypothetical protein